MGGWSCAAVLLCTENGGRERAGRLVAGMIGRSRASVLLGTERARGFGHRCAGRRLVEDRYRAPVLLDTEGAMGAGRESGGRIMVGCSRARRRVLSPLGAGRDGAGGAARAGPVLGPVGESAAGAGNHACQGIGDAGHGGGRGSRFVPWGVASFVDVDL
jgi:hypothetical protein